jgi:hypothetical protein
LWLLLSCCLLGLSCSDMTLYRAKGDYFPLISGTRWTYQYGSTTSVDSVAGDRSIAGRACVVVLRDYAPEFWTKGQNEVRRYVDLTVSRAGTDYTLEERYALVYALPFVLGATWYESFRDTVVLAGIDTVLVRDSIFGRVAAIEDVQTPAGTIIQCYRIETHRDVEATDTTSTDLTEWFAPDVGLVKSQSGTDEKVLIDFEPGH